jgi:hypothetical protein
VLVIAAAVTGQPAPSIASPQNEEQLEPGDPIASVDSEPVFLGELNLLLKSQLQVKDLDRVSLQVKRASCLMIIRQHLALKSLRELGGQTLEALLTREWEAFNAELERQGLTVQSYCERFESNPEAVRFSRDWSVAWQRYLKSKLTEENLRRFYDRFSDRYADTIWKVSHLVITADEDSPGAKQIAKQRMQAIVEKLQTAESQDLTDRFAQLARLESDGATADRGGDLGWVTSQGDLPSGLMAAIRHAELGSITPIVESPFGFHVALVKERKSRPVPYDQLEDRSQLRRDAADALFAALISRSANAEVRWLIERLRPPAS